MADRYGQRVCRVVRPRHGLKVQHTPYHLHHLFLLRTTVTGYREFDLKRCVFVHGHALLFSGKDYHAPAVSDGDAGRNIRVEKKLFYRYRVMPERINQLSDIAVDLPESCRQPYTGRRRYRAVSYHLLRAALGAYDSETDRRYTRVDAKYDHISSRGVKPNPSYSYTTLIITYEAFEYNKCSPPAPSFARVSLTNSTKTIVFGSAVCYHIFVSLYIFSIISGI